MADVHFKCPACEQSLVSEETAAGFSISCPHCGKTLQIPLAARDISDERAQKSLSKWVARASALENDLRAVQQRLADTESLYAESQVAVTEMKQRLRVAAAEGNCVQAEAITEKSRRETLESALQEARTDASTAWQEVDELQTSFRVLERQKEAAVKELTHLRKLLEDANSERNDLLADFAQKSAAHSEALIGLDAARKERQEMAGTLQRTQTELAHLQEKFAALERERARLAADLDAATMELPRSQKSLGRMTQERDRLLATIQQNPRLADNLALKNDRDRLEGELRDLQATLGDTRNKLQALQAERETLRSENKSLHLKISAMRDLHSDTQLVQDNETLRGIIERLHEELKERGPAPARKRRPEPASRASRLSESVRTFWSRYVLSDSDTVA